MNLRTAMPIIKFFNTTFYISVFNVEATLRYCKENTSKCVISVIAIAMLNLHQVVFLASTNQIGIWVIIETSDQRCLFFFLFLRDIK